MCVDQTHDLHIALSRTFLIASIPKLAKLKRATSEWALMSLSLLKISNYWVGDWSMGAVHMMIRQPLIRWCKMTSQHGSGGTHPPCGVCQVVNGYLIMGLVMVPRKLLWPRGVSNHWVVTVILWYLSKPFGKEVSLVLGGNAVGSLWNGLTVFSLGLLCNSQLQPGFLETAGLVWNRNKYPLSPTARIRK
jgi:hypothetical protein